MISAALLGVGALCGFASCAAKPRLKWLAFYGHMADEQVLAAYDIVILDPGFAGSIARVGLAGARVCAYLSLGEIRSADPYFPLVSRAAVLDENPAWPGSFRLDVRERSWHDLVLHRIIPDIAAKGFTGLLLDTLDTPPYLEQLAPNRNHGMRQAAAGLVRSICNSYPAMHVLMNRGYALLPKVAESIDGVVAESLLTTVDPTRAGAYKWNADAEVSGQLSLLAPAVRRGLPILALDYWDPADPATIRQIYGRERRLGHHPYVATQLLEKIVPEPPALTTVPLSTPSGAASYGGRGVFGWERIDRVRRG